MALVPPISTLLGGVTQAPVTLHCSSRKGQGEEVGGQHSQAKELGWQLGDTCGIKTSLWRRGRAVSESRQAWEERPTQSRGHSGCVEMPRCHQVNLLATTSLLRKSILNGHPTLGG